MKVLTLTDNLISDASPNRVKIDEVPEIFNTVSETYVVCQEFRTIQEYRACRKHQQKIATRTTKQGVLPLLHEHQRFLSVS